MPPSSNIPNHNSLSPHNNDSTPLRKQTSNEVNNKKKSENLSFYFFLFKESANYWKFVITWNRREFRSSNLVS